MPPICRPVLRCLVAGAFVLALTLGGGGGLGSLPDRAAAATNCPRVLVLGVRGSGQTSRDFYGYGQPVWGTVRNILPETPPSVEHAEPTDYPSVAVSKWGFINGLGAVTRTSGIGLGAYNDSVNDGKKELRAKIAWWTARCSAAHTQLVLVGYSQGAQVAGDVYQAYGRANFAWREAHFGGLVLFGDPTFNPNSPGVYKPSGFSTNRHGLLGTRDAFSPQAAVKIRSYCHAHDAVCQGPGWGTSPTTPEHFTYDDTGEAADAGRWLSTRLRAWIAAHPLPGVATTPVTAPVAPITDIGPGPDPNPGGGGSTPGPAGVPETAGGVVHTWTDPSSAGGTEGPSVANGQSVTIECKLQGFRVANGNSWWYRIASAPWSSSYYGSADAFYNNGATSGPLAGTPFVDPAVPDCGSAPPPVTGTPSGAITETVGGVTHTWTNPANAGGSQGPSIQTGQSVGIACKLQGFRVADGNTWWYRIASAPWSGSYYASADAFYNNGATSGSLVGTPFVDLNVPDCAASPPPPAPTWSETAGGVAHTWTNPANAGGTQGPSIGGGQTVQIACRLQAFRVADGNTWWYRIAQSPWNNQYYVSADAFYNNGATSGTLIGTPFVDTAVASC